MCLYSSVDMALVLKHAGSWVRASLADFFFFPFLIYYIFHVTNEIDYTYYYYYLFYFFLKIVKHVKFNIQLFP